MIASAERRALVTSLRVGDTVSIGRDQNQVATCAGVVEVISHGVVKVRVGAARIAFFPTGLERGSGSGGLMRGLRVLLAVLARKVAA